MRVLISLTAFAALASLFVLVHADDWESIGRDGPRLPRDEYLAEISPFAALLQSAQIFRLESSCAAAEFLDTAVLGNERDGENRFLEEFVAGIGGECELLRLSVGATEPVFQSIKEAGALPETAYVFSLFVYDANLEGGTAGYAEETVGLFSDLEACSRIEHAARELSLPTRRCVVWTGLDPL